MNFNPGQQPQSVVYKLESKVMNSQEHPSTLLFQRLSNTAIQEQMISLLVKAEEWEQKQEHTSLLFNSEDRLIPDSDSKYGYKYEVVPYEMTSEDVLRDIYARTLERVKTVTYFDYTENSPQGGDVDSPEIMSLSFKWPQNGGEMTSRQKEIVESHEKGHSMRQYKSDFFNQYFASGFDLEKCIFPEWMLEWLRKKHSEECKRFETEEYKTDDELMAEYKQSIFCGPEIAERMSQMKAYVGIADDGLFTVEDLNYTKENVKDTGVDNAMSIFFSAITLETQDEFIRLINSSGI
jgi:hypothetical protein